MHRFVASSASLLALSLVAAFAGCSSSNGGGGGSNTDGGTDGAVHKDAGGSSSGGDSGGSSGGDSGDDGGGACPDNTPFTPVAYAPVTAHKGVCTTSDIAAFVAACGDNGTQTTCGNWQTANVAGQDGGGGNACGNCILDPKNAGGTWVDQMGFFGPNYAGCIQLTDTANGPTCAPAYEKVNDCHGFECDSCTDNATFTTCATTVDGTICKQYADAEKTACAADLAAGGAESTCMPGKATQKQDPDFTYIVTLICGGASSDGGGPTDAGGGG